MRKISLSLLLATAVLLAVFAGGCNLSDRIGNEYRARKSFYGYASQYDGKVHYEDSRFPNVSPTADNIAGTQNKYSASARIFEGRGCGGYRAKAPAQGRRIPKRRVSKPVIDPTVDSAIEDQSARVIPDRRKPTSTAELIDIDDCSVGSAVAIDPMFAALASALITTNKDPLNKGSLPNPNTRELPVIMYHSILKSRAGKFVVSPDTLTRDMEYIISLGYTTVFPSEILAFVSGEGSLPPKPILITFDDGYYNNMVYALPIFRQLGLKGVINIVGQYADKAVAEGDNNPNYSHLTWDQMRELSNSGHFEIGNHTYDMHQQKGRYGVTQKCGEDVDCYRRAITDDIGKLQQLLTERSGITPTVFAYPFGKYNSHTKQIIQDMGFRLILTCNEGVNTLTIGDTDSLLRLKRYNRPSGISTKAFFDKIHLQ